MADPIRYIDVAGFTLATSMPATDVAGLQSGFLQKRIDLWCSYINSRLVKRYAVPFDVNDPPGIVMLWLCALLTKDAYDKRGHNSTSVQDESAIEEPAKRALEEIKEAADAKDGLFDLPLREADTGKSGISVGPLCQSDVSPYDWIDTEAEALGG